jgi:uncharacterized membrane protein
MKAQLINLLKQQSGLLILAVLFTYQLFFKRSESTQLLIDAQAKAVQATALSENTLQQATELQEQLAKANARLDVATDIIAKSNLYNRTVEAKYQAEKRSSVAQADSILYYLNQLKQIQKSL